MNPKSDQPLTGISPAEHARRRGIRRKMDLLTILANSLGAILASFFFTIQGSAYFSTLAMAPPFLQIVLYLLLPASLMLSNDEFGDLAAGFNAMVAGLRQEEVIRQLFNLYVTPEVATHAIAHGAELGGQLTRATVLFSDIRGFTSMTEQMDPQALIALLNRYFAVMSHVVRERGGLVNKFGGDSLLAVFGSPLNPLREQALQAVRTAQGMAGALEDFNADQRSRGEPEISIGVGIATGRVIAGNVGSRERLEYTVIGDAVNVASRLQGLTKRLEALVLLDEETARVVSERLSLEPRGEVEVRGKKKPVSLYALRLEER